MNNILSKYSFIVLDSSSLFYPLEDSLLEEMKKHSDIYVPKTFNDECDALKQFMVGEKLTNYKKNIKTIKTLTLQQLACKELSINIDTFGTVWYFANQKVDVLILTANQILMNKVVLGNTQADIYDIQNHALIKYVDFPKFHQTFETTLSENVLPCGEISNGKILFKENGESIAVSDLYNKDGSEAELYKIDCFSDVLAKIYLENKLTAEKLNNIKNLIAVNKSLNITWCTFPEEIIYYDKERKQPIGYTMRFARNIQVFANQTLYTGEMRDILIQNRDTRLSSNIETCLQIVRQVLFLNFNGILVSDYNDGNFAFQSGTLKEIMMLDTDSFGYKEYFSDRRAPYDSYTRSYGSALTKIEAIDFSYESLYIFIFRLLALGFEPLFKSKFKFRQDRKHHYNDFRLSFFTGHLNKYFLKVFDRKESSSIYELLYELNSAKKFLKRNKAKDKTYREIASSIIYVTRCDNLADEFTCILSNFSHNRIDEQVVNDIDGELQLQDKRGDSAEIMHFKKNDDGTYIITHLSNNSFVFLTSTENKDGSNVYFSNPTSTYSQKWRIEIESKKLLDDGCEEYFCVIGSELAPDLVLSVNNGMAFQLSVRSEEDAQLCQHFTILKIAETDYLYKTKQERDKKESTEKLQKEQEAAKLKVKNEQEAREKQKRQEWDNKIRKQNEKMRKKAIIAISLIAAVFVIIVGIALLLNYYLNNQYSHYIKYVDTNIANILFVGGLAESLQVESDVPKFGKDSYTYISADNSTIMTDGNTITPIDVGYTQVKISSTKTGKEYVENWYVLNWRDLDHHNALHRGDIVDLTHYLPQEVVKQIINEQKVSINDVLSSLVTFQTSDENVLNIDEKGIVTATGKGSANITIKQGDLLLKTYNFTVSVAIQELNVNTTSVSLEMGETYQLTAGIIPVDADTTISYSSHNIDISSSGLIKAPSYHNSSTGGSYEVTVSSGGLTKNVNITVHNSYTIQWNDSEMNVRDIMDTPMVFNNIVPNCTGFKLGHMIQTTSNEYDFDKAYLGYDWEVYTYDGQGGSAQYVGKIKMMQKDQFEYIDVTFSKRDVLAIFVIPSSNISSAYCHGIHVSELNYNGYIH